MRHTASAFRPRVEQLEDRTVPSTTVLTVSPNPVTVGQSITLTAVVADSGSDSLQPGRGIPQGTVTFFDGSVTLGTISVTPSSMISTQGSAQFTTTTLGVGSHSLKASYSGEYFYVPPNYHTVAASTSNAVSEFVNPFVAADVTALTKVTVRHLPGNEALVTVKSKTGQTLGDPLELEITGLPKTVHLLGKHGTVRAHRARGSPYVVDNVTLGPGGFVGFLVQFSDQGNKRFGFDVRVLAGPGAV
jgi:hypothetical protein